MDRDKRVIVSRYADLISRCVDIAELAPEGSKTKEHFENEALYLCDVLKSELSKKSDK